MATIELGGKIFLEGFDVLDHAELLIAKKLVGSYVRQACEAGCDKASLYLTEQDGSYTVKVSIDDGLKKSEATGQNVFMAIDAALKGLLVQLQ